MLSSFTTRIRAPLVAFCLIVGFSTPVRAQMPQPPAVPQPPVQPQPPAQPAQPTVVRDPRVDQMRQAAERLGQRVQEALLVRQPNGTMGWIVITTAAYAQPSFDGVFTQAHNVWWAMYGIIPNEPPDTTIMVNGQVWNRFIINQFVSLKSYLTFLSAYRAAQTDAQRLGAFKGLLDSSSYSVFDIERGQYVDTKDFSNKHYTR